MTNNINIDINYLLGKIVESNYEHPGFAGFYDPRYSHHFPLFTMTTAKTMMRDPRIKFGLSLIKGPIVSKTKFYSKEDAESPAVNKAIIELDYYFPYKIECDDKETEKFIIKQFNRFWETGIIKALTAVEMGYSGSEVIYKRDSKGRLAYNDLILFPAESLTAVTRRRGLIGFSRDQTKKHVVPLGKGFWHIHGREQDRYYGESRLLGAHVPWHETWSPGGARDCRRTWFFKNAYNGGTLWFPEGSFKTREGVEISHEEFVTRILAMKRSGSTMTLPSERDAQGKQIWDYEEPSANMAPTGLHEYINQLRDEELEGLGIPPEVIQSSGDTGMGSATGRIVPLEAYISSLTPLGTYAIGDFDTQILKILLHANNMKADYDISKVVPRIEEEASSNITDTVKDTGLAVAS